MLLSGPIGAAADVLGEPLAQRVRRPLPDAVRRPREPHLGGPHEHRPWAGDGLLLRLMLPDAGFLAHLITAAEPEAGAPAVLPSGLEAYRLRLGARITYSGPVRPVDVRI